MQPSLGCHWLYSPASLAFYLFRFCSTTVLLELTFPSINVPILFFFLFFFYRRKPNFPIACMDATFKYQNQMGRRWGDNYMFIIFRISLGPWWLNNSWKESFAMPTQTEARYIWLLIVVSKRPAHIVRPSRWTSVFIIILFAKTAKPYRLKQVANPKQRLQPSGTGNLFNGQKSCGLEPEWLTSMFEYVPPELWPSPKTNSSTVEYPVGIGHLKNRS